MNESPGASSEFAPADRAGDEELRRDIAVISGIPLIDDLYDAVPEIVLVLNRHRQIVFANKATQEVFQLPERATIYGLRPGEALDCQHADETPGGCGTTRFCRECGAVRAILSGLRGRKTVDECRLLRKGMDALDLSVVSTPLETDGRTYAIFAVMDISNEKRRHVLERMFLHDVSNTLTVLRGAADLAKITGWRNPKAVQYFDIGLQALSAEVQAQKELLAAEHGELVVHPQPVSSLAVLRDLAGVYQRMELARAKPIEVAASSADVQFAADQTQLVRVLGNMLKNALEASAPGERVVAGCTWQDGAHVRFWVQNAHAMPPEVQLQVFNRSYSTKGKGRGLGTYAMKLLCERYLEGHVSFACSPEQGTIFSITLPLGLRQRHE